MKYKNLIKIFKVLNYVIVEVQIKITYVFGLVIRKTFLFVCTFS